MGRFGAVDGLILLALQFAALAIVLRPAGLGWLRIALITLATYFAAFVAHIIGFILLPDTVPKLPTRIVISLLWLSASCLACWPFLRNQRRLILSCGLAATLAYLIFAFGADFLKPA